MKSVYCAVRTRSLNKAVCASSLNCQYITSCCYKNKFPFQNYTYKVSRN